MAYQNIEGVCTFIDILSNRKKKPSFANNSTFCSGDIFQVKKYTQITKSTSSSTNEYMHDWQWPKIRTKSKPMCTAQAFLAVAQKAQSMEGRRDRL